MHHHHQKQKRDHKPRMESGTDPDGGGPPSTVALSKALTWLLRHNAPKENVPVAPGGFVDIDNVLNHRRFKRWNMEDIKTAVKNCDKQRFAIRTDPQTEKLQIRANQGHSFPIEDLALEEIKDGSECAVVIHGTYLRFWDSIKKTGLSRMNRNHIHFAAGEPGTDGVISGMRNSTHIYIYIDLPKALNDGLKFYRSENNVILSPGNAEGYILSTYFLKVIDTRSGKNLL